MGLVEEVDVPKVLQSSEPMSDFGDWWMMYCRLGDLWITNQPLKVWSPDSSNWVVWKPFW